MGTGIVRRQAICDRGQGPIGTFHADRFKIERDVPRRTTCARSHAAKTDGKTDKTKIYLYGNVHMTIYEARDGALMRVVGYCLRVHWHRLIAAPAQITGSSDALQRRCKPPSRIRRKAAAHGFHAEQVQEARSTSSSDNFEGDFQTKVGTYIGNVIVTQADCKLRADKVRRRSRPRATTSIV